VKQKWTTIQALRGIGVLAVLAAHMMYVERETSPGEALLPQFDRICKAAIDMFFVISGLVLVTAARGTGVLRGAAAFLYQRAARVYPLYWICTAVVVLIALWRPELRVSRWWSDYPGDHLRSLLLLPQDGGPVLGVAWTLVHEMYFYVVLAAIGLAGERRTVRLLLAWAALVFLGRCCLDRGSALRNPFTDLVTHPITADFILGCLAGVALHRGLRSYARWSWLAGAGLIVVGFVVFSAGLTRMHHWPRALLYGLPCALIAYGVAADERRLAPLVPRWLRGLGNASYSIYLTHLLVICLVVELWKGTSAPGYGDNVIALVGMGAAALLVGILVYRLVEAPLMSLTRWPRRRAVSVPDRAMEEIAVPSPPPLAPTLAAQPGSHRLRRRPARPGRSHDSTIPR
jgi:exopolysaccharide production protein ExoZ